MQEKWEDTASKITNTLQGEETKSLMDNADGCEQIHQNKCTVLSHQEKSKLANIRYLIQLLNENTLAEHELEKSLRVTDLKVLKKTLAAVDITGELHHCIPIEITQKWTMQANQMMQAKKGG